MCPTDTYLSVLEFRKKIVGDGPVEEINFLTLITHSLISKNKKIDEKR